MENCDFNGKGMLNNKNNENSRKSFLLSARVNFDLCFIDHE